MKDTNQDSSQLTRRQFLIYSTAVTSAVTAGVILKTDAQANLLLQDAGGGLNDGMHGIYGYT